MSRRAQVLAGLAVVAAAVCTVAAWVDRPARRCGREADPGRRELCLVDAGASKATPMDWEGILERTAEPHVRDLIRLRLVVEDPRWAWGLCEEMEGAQARDLCDNVAHRSHLWRGEPGGAAGISGSSPPAGFLRRRKAAEPGAP